MADIETFEPDGRAIPYAEDRRKQAAQLKKIQGYLHRAQTIVKEVRIQQVPFPVSLTRLDRVPTLSH